MNELIQRLIAIAREEVGVREAGGNNRGARIEEYQQATWSSPGPWPWCAAFMSWVMREWLENEAVRAALNLPTAIVAQKWRCRDTRAFWWESWARQKGLTVLSETDLARAGDFVVFDFSHIGLVVADQKPGEGFIQTIEGNTNGRGERDSETGDGVWEKQRAKGLTKSYIRIFA